MESTKYVYRVEMEWTEKDGVHRDNTFGVASDPAEASKKALEAFGPIVKERPDFSHEEGYRVVNVEEQGRALFK